MALLGIEGLGFVALWPEHGDAAIGGLAGEVVGDGTLGKTEVVEVMRQQRVLPQGPD